MSVFDPLHHDHINTPVNTPLITSLELQMVGGVSHENWGVITPWGGSGKITGNTHVARQIDGDSGWGGGVRLASARAAAAAAAACKATEPGASDTTGRAWPVY